MIHKLSALTVKLYLTLLLSPLLLLASPVKSEEAAKGIAYIEDGSSAPTAADYIQEGLVAMWDGIENAGHGVHLSNPVAWSDLSGNGLDIVVPTGAFGNNFYNMSKESGFAFPYSLPESTVECIVSIEKWQNDRAGIFLCLSELDIAFGRYNSIGIFSKKGTWHSNTQYILPSPYPMSMSVSFYAGGKSALFDGVVPATAKEYWTQIPGTSIGSRYNTGKIFCIRIYNRLLTDEEKLYNYTIDRLRFNLQ